MYLEICTPFGKFHVKLSTFGLTSIGYFCLLSIF